MGHLEGNFTPVLYIGRKVPKGSKAMVSYLCVCVYIYIYIKEGKWMFI